MKKNLIMAMAVCVVLCGCRAGVSMADENTDTEISVGIFNADTSYFDRYSIDKKEDSCKVKGKLHQAADDGNGELVYVTAAKGGGSVNVTGKMECTRGTLQLVYTAPDGTETLLAAGTDKKIDVQVDVAQGEGKIGFVSDGERAVCDFSIKMNAGEGVTFAGIMEQDEVEPKTLEEIELIEKPEKPKKAWESDIGNSSSLEKEAENIDAEFDEMADESHLDKIVENTWPEKISYQAQYGVWANPMSTKFEVEAPVTVMVSCKTLEGKVRLQIVKNDWLNKQVYFDEKDPDGSYTVKLDQAGEYKILIYAKEHVGSVEIMPE